jgi:hypothetical protein
MKKFLTLTVLILAPNAFAVGLGDINVLTYPSNFDIDNASYDDLINRIHDLEDRLNLINRMTLPASNNDTSSDNPFSGCKVCSFNSPAGEGGGHAGTATGGGTNHPGAGSVPTGGDGK